MKLTEAQALDVERQRARAEQLFPREWAAAQALPGERRRKRLKALRDAAIEADGRAKVVAQGGSCKNCDNLLRNPAGLAGLFCALNSDFHGYAGTKEKNVCSRWSPLGLSTLEASRRAK